MLDTMISRITEVKYKVFRDCGYHRSLCGRHRPLLHPGFQLRGQHYFAGIGVRAFKTDYKSQYNNAQDIVNNGGA